MRETVSKAEMTSKRPGGSEARLCAKDHATTKCSGRWCSTSHEVACGAVRHQHSPQHCNLEDVRSLVTVNDIGVCVEDELHQSQCVILIEDFS